MPMTPFAYKMCINLKEQGFQWPSFPTPCWHIEEGTCSLFGADIQKPFQFEGKTCMLGINPNKDHPLLEP